MPRGYRITRTVRTAVRYGTGDFVFHLLSKQNNYEKVCVEVEKNKCKIKRKHSVYPVRVERKCKCDTSNVTIRYHKDGSIYVDEFMAIHDASGILFWREIMAKIQNSEHTADIKFSFSRIN